MDKEPKFETRYEIFMEIKNPTFTLHDLGLRLESLGATKIEFYPKDSIKYLDVWFSKNLEEKSKSLLEFLDELEQSMKVFTYDKFWIRGASPR